MKNSLEFKLAKLLIAAAWADGDIHADEINVLKDLIFNLAGISGEDWQLLELYMDSPMSEEENNHLLEDLINTVTSLSDKLLVSNTLRELIEADGTVSKEEEEFINKVEEAMSGVRTDPISMIGGFLKKSLVFKGKDTPKREKHFQDYVKNTVYYQLCHDDLQNKFAIDDSALRKLSLKAGFLAKVCYQDGKPDNEEVRTAQNILKELESISDDEAGILIDAGLKRVAKGLDYRHTCRNYFEITEYEERCEFIKVLFRVAAASNGSSHAEIEIIRDIATHLKIPRSKFIEAKLTVFPD